MTHYIGDSYIESDYDDIINNWYEIEGVRKIEELSRQLRTFFNFKAKVIRYRFRSNLSLIENDINTKFFTQKQKIETTSHKFITSLKKIKKNGQTLEQGIQSLYFQNYESQLKEISVISEKLSILLHYFSEERIYNHPKFLKFITILAQNICLVKKYLNAQFSEFYEELDMNYNCLERELEFLIEEVQGGKNIKSRRPLEERMTT